MQGCSIGVWDEKKRSESWYNMGPSSCLLLLQHINRECNNTTSLKSQDLSEPVLSLFTQWTIYSQTPSSLPNLQPWPKSTVRAQILKGLKCFGEKEVSHILNCSTTTAVNHRSCFVAEYKKDARCHVKHCNSAFVPSMTSVVFTLTVQNYIHRYSKHLLI